MHLRLKQIVLIGLAALLASPVKLPAAAAAPNTLIARGDQQWAEGRFDLAEESFKQAVIADPRSLSAHMKLAGLQLSQHEFKASIETYQRAIGLDANSAKAWLGLGFSYLHTGKNDLALAAFNEAVRVDPVNKEKLAPVLAKIGRP